VADIKQAIYTYGPVAAAMAVGPLFQAYTGGVFNGDEAYGNANNINHAIGLVGWDDDYYGNGSNVGVWILKNSWGPWWGDDGFMYIQYGTSMVGYAATYVELDAGEAPDDPSDLTATSVSASQIDLLWEDNSDNGTGFKLERKDDWNGWSQIGIVAENITSFCDVGLNPGTTYYYRIRAYNNYGNSGYSNETWASTESLPPVPVGTYDDTDPNITYNGNWIPYNTTGPYNNTMHYSATTGNTASFNFTGQGLTLIYAGYSNRGEMGISIDGVDYTLNQYSPTLQRQQEWISPTLSTGSHTVSFEHLSGPIADIDAIIVKELGEISGSKWNDLNGDGIWDAGETGLSNWKIYMDENTNGQWDSGEPYDLTDANGDYSFVDLEAGTYIVTEVLESGWEQTYPSGSLGVAIGLSGPTTYGDMLTLDELEQIERMDMNSPPFPPLGIESTIVFSMPQSALVLSVPTSTWSYGCSATAAGMIFGYYDRPGFSNMYTGPTNGGVAPLTDLCQGNDPANPIPGSCSICSTQQGFDGRTTMGHVNDYWISYNSPGPDPWEGSWLEHTWGECTTDYMGTNQWKWDFGPWPNGDGITDNNVDGGTILFTYNSSERLYDYIPPSNLGLPATALCYGLRLFAESLGYTVEQNYTQVIDTVYTGGFSFAGYMAEIDTGSPVMIHVTGHSMVGVGYDEPTQTVYLHDTWDNNVHSMTWGGSYAGMANQAVTVINFAESKEGAHTVTLEQGEVAYCIDFGNH